MITVFLVPWFWARAIAVYWVFNYNLQFWRLPPRCLRRFLHIWQPWRKFWARFTKVHRDEPIPFTLRSWNYVEMILKVFGKMDENGVKCHPLTSETRWSWWIHLHVQSLSSHKVAFTSSPRASLKVLTSSQTDTMFIIIRFVNLFFDVCLIFLGGYKTKDQI